MFSLLLSALLAFNTMPDLDPAAKERGKGNYDQALASIQKVIETDETEYGQGWAYMEKGRTLRLQGHFKEALAAEEKALKLSHSDLTGNLYSFILYEKSQCLAGLGKTDQAIEILEKAMQAVKDDPIRYAQMKATLSEFYLQKGDAEKAKGILEEALELQMALFKQVDNREVASTYQRLAEASLSLGDLDGAEEKALQSHAMDKKLLRNTDHPEFGADYVLFAKIAEKRNDTETAIEHYTEALKIYENKLPNHPEVLKIRQKLQDLSIKGQI